MQEIFRISDFTFQYPETAAYALSGVTLSVEQGDFLVLCGPSGCGKSTLLRQLKTTLAPHGVKTGEIRFCGKPLSGVPNRTQASEIGFVQQAPEEQVLLRKMR